MSDVEEFSHAAKLGGLRTLQIDRYVANEAAVNCVGPPSEKQSLEHYVRQFHEFLKQAGNNQPERELRRRVLLMVTEGRDRMGPSDRDASKIRKVVDDVSQVHRLNPGTPTNPCGGLVGVPGCRVQARSR